MSGRTALFIIIVLSQLKLLRASTGHFAETENVYLNSIENEFIKAKLKFGESDPALFQDLLELKVSITIDSFYTENDKLRFYETLFSLLKDMNVNIHSARRIEERDYRRAVRFLPTVFHYIHENRLAELLTQYPHEAIKVIPFLSHEDASKTALAQIGLDNPNQFYNNVEELSTYKYFTSIFIYLGVYDPIQWLSQIDKNPFLSDIAYQSSNPIIKKILDIKERLGITSNVFYFLDEIIRNSFNDTHEIDLSQQREYLTKKALEAATNAEAYGNTSALNGIPILCKWMFEEYIEGRESVLSEYSNNQILIAMAMTHSIFEYDDLVSLMSFMKKNDANLITIYTLNLIPKKTWHNFIKKMQKAELISKLVELSEPEAAAYIMMYDKYGEAEKLALKNQNWFSAPYSYEKEKQERLHKRNKNIAHTFHLNKTQISLLSWSRNLNKVDSNIVGIMKSSIASRFIDYLTRYHPQVLANTREKIKSLPEFPTMVSKLSENSPNTIKKYLASEENPITSQIKSSNNSASKTILEIYNRYKFNTKAYVLIHKILNGELTLDRAHEISNSPVGLLRTLMNITIQKNPKGIHSVEEEQNQISLKFIREINDNPSSSHPNLQVIQGFNAKELYSLMVLGKEEIFQFAFDHLYKYLNQELSEQSLISFLPNVNYYKYREFCVLMANFRKFPELFYKNTTEEERNKFLHQMVHIDFSDVKCIEQAAVLCEFINNCDYNEIQIILQNQIRVEFQNAEFNKDQLGMAVYSLLASNIGHRALVHKDWYSQMEQKYSQFSLSYIDVDDIKDKRNRIIEVSYFYNDADGIASFNSFINTFRNMNKWYLQDLGSYYFISSLEGNDFDIFANKPQYEQVGQNAIKEYLLVNQLEPSIIVHRGHSYHSQKTIDQMIGSPKFIFMGSCGGYYKISELLVRSPNAQILSTKQVGTMSINDPMLRTIHETFRTNQNIVWPTFWNQQEIRLGGLKDFKMYVPPHKNNGALFVNAFFKVVGL